MPYDGGKVNVYTKKVHLHLKIGYSKRSKQMPIVYYIHLLKK